MKIQDTSSTYEWTRKKKRAPPTDRDFIFISSLILTFFKCVELCNTFYHAHRTGRHIRVRCVHDMTVLVYCRSTIESYYAQYL